jgi:DNA-binding NarL/FixJ family response regulator
MLAGVLGDWELAEGHFEAAAALNQRLGARTWLAHTLCEHGRMLLRRDRARDRKAAEAKLEQALALATQHGLSRVLARARGSGATASVTVAEEGLSGREIDVLRLVAQGLSNREIGRALFISEHTTASHIRSILRKTGASNRTEAAAYAHRRGLVN